MSASPSGSARPKSSSRFKKVAALLEPPAAGTGPGGTTPDARRRRTRCCHRRPACQALNVPPATAGGNGPMRRVPARAAPSQARAPSPPPSKPSSSATQRAVSEPRAAAVYATLLDEGHYHCSIRTMYRLLEQRGESRERRDNSPIRPIRSPNCNRHRPQSGLELGHHQTAQAARVGPTITST